MSHVHVITGAGSGLGRAIAVELARGGAQLTLAGRREAPLVQTESLCLAAGAPKCLVTAADITARGAPESVITATLEAFGALDGLVNNAGLARFAPIGAADDGDWEAMIRTNLLGPCELIRAAVPALADRGGAVVNVASIGGVLATPNRSVYGASKAALIHLTRSLARELAPRVRVNAVVPGAIDTPMYDDLGLDEAATARLRAEMIATTPLGRFGTAADVAPWVTALLGPQGSWVTGAVMTIDGGRSC